MRVRERLLWWLLWPALTAFAVTAEVLHARAGSDENVFLEFLGGYSFAVAGLIAWRLRPANHLGRLMTVVAALWFVGAYGDADAGIVRSIGIAFAGLEPIAISHLALAYPAGRLERRPQRVLIFGAYFVALLANRLTDDSTDKVAGAVVLVAVILLVRRLLLSSVTQRWLLAPLWVVAAVAGTIFVVRTTVNFVEISVDALGTVDDVLNGITTLVPAVFLIGLLRRRLESSPIGDLVVALGGATTTETLQRALARTLRDPSVELAYWLPERGTYVDAEGHEFAMPMDGVARSTTFVERDGERLAAIVHDRALLENPRLVEAATAAAGLALENERLQAELRAKIVEVEASRVRIIEAGDDARRRIERDLHDGAQQRLLATALSLRLASDALDERIHPAGRLALESAAAETLDALAELRELAHGIHPAVLTEQGLRAAVEVLAERAPVAVLIDVPHDRFATSIEATAYYVVSEALANVAKHAHATRVTVRARADGGSLVVDVIDDGAGGAAPTGGTGLSGLDDRVSALGGRLDLRSVLGEGTRLRIELPCS
ncbi:MAG TPA: ATP-binding protein [Nocardioidaceae bacterium]|nr:ATP-binding protein [Nocardioidaceae bacterium]